MLRNVVEGDLQTFFEHQRDPEATSMAAFPAREWDAFMSHWRHKVLGDPANEARTILVDDPASYQRGYFRLDESRIGRAPTVVEVGALLQLLEDSQSLFRRRKRESRGRVDRRHVRRYGLLAKDRVSAAYGLEGRVVTPHGQTPVQGRIGAAG